jgi:iron complex transport system substrate-binding protein
MITAVRRGLAATLILAGCSRGRTGPGSGFHDPEGRRITVPHLPARRIVSTMQSATEWLVALGAADRLVARTDYDHEPALATLPSIGGGLDPSPEVIATLQPDVVIGWQSRASVDLEHALKPFHIPVIAMETTDTADVFRDLTQIGVLVGVPQRADSAAQALREQLHAVQQAACPNGAAGAPTVMLVLWTDPPMTAGGGTWMSTVLAAACLRNAFGDLSTPWPTVSMEAITARQPDWLLLSSADSGRHLADLRRTSGWRDLDAVRAGRILEIPADLLARAGPTIPDAARAIVAAYHAALRARGGGG